MSNKNFTLSPALLRIICAILILCVTGLILLLKQPDDPADYSIRVIEPTCTDKGYSLYTNNKTGEISVKDPVDAKGHSFNQWILTDEGDEVNCGFSERTCEVCDFKETRAEYPNLQISRISLYGSLDGIGKTTSVPMTAQLELKEDGISIECYATLKYQGHISLSYDKKNYTLKLFKDEERQEKYKLTLSHWNKESKYILKANYVDATQCRNLISANVWAAMCASRPSIAEELKTSSNYGAVDGYPVAVYINDQFHGLYNMNLHKDDDLYNMNDGKQNAIMICNHNTTPEATFNAEAEFTEVSPWEVEYCGTEDTSWAKESFNQLIRFVIESDDLTFREKLSEYLDVDAAIDYLIAIYALGLNNHKAQDLVLVSYGGVWIPSLYDMETAFGLSENGSTTYAPTEFLPRLTESGWDSGTGHLLWDRLLQNFEDKIFERYNSLRSEILDPQSICDQITTFTDAIPIVFYDTEEFFNPHPQSYKNSKMQILGYIFDRIEVLDDIFLKGLD